MAKIGKYDVIVKDGDKELDTIPNDLPVFDFEGNQITMQEAQQGYMRTADYTKKTQQVAQVRKFLTEDLGFQEDVQGVAVMKQVLDTLATLEEKGIYDPKTGEVKVPEIKKPKGKELDLDDEGFTLSEDLLPEAVRHKLKRFDQLEKDMGSLMGYLSRKEIRESLKELAEEEVEMVHKLAAIDPSKSPMEHALAYTEQKKGWGQQAVDAYVESLKKPKDDGHDRKTSGEPAIEIFGEKPVFSYDPGAHKGENVISPSEAASKYLEAAMDELRGKQ
jgi:hypothetical protein